MTNRATSALTWLFALSFAGFGCASQPAPRVVASEFRIAAAEFERPPRAVTGAEAASDFSTAVRAFDEAYAGLEGRARTPAPGELEAERGRLASRASWSPW